jgi:hypothetical protein
VDDRRSGRTVRLSARLAFTIGVLASLAANVSAAHPSLGARIVAAWPALALLLTVELLSRSGRVTKKSLAAAKATASLAAARDEATSVATPTEAPSTPAAAAPLPERPRISAPPALVQSALAEASAALAGATSPRTTAPRSTASKSNSSNGNRVTAAVRSGGPVRATATIKPTGEHTTEARLAAVRQRAIERQRAAEQKRTGGAKSRRSVAETRALAAAIEAERPDATPEDIAAQLGISTRRLREVLASTAA